MLNRNLPYFILLSCVMILATIGAVQAKNVEFSDNFNRANNNVIGNGWLEYNDGVGGVGDHMIIFNNQVLMESFGNYFWMRQTFTPELTNNSYQMHFNLAQNGTEFILLIQDGTKRNLTYITKVVNNSLVTVTDGGADVREIADWSECSKNEYHNLTLKNINYVDKTFDVWFDGNETNSDVPFYQENFTGINNLTIIWPFTGTHLWLDDIEIYQLDAEAEEEEQGALLFFIGLAGLLFAIIIARLGINNAVIQPAAVVFPPWIFVMLTGLAINIAASASADVLANLETFYVVMLWVASIVTFYYMVYYVYKIYLTKQRMVNDAANL